MRVGPLGPAQINQALYPAAGAGWVVLLAAVVQITATADWPGRK
jgi:hypothetical protein